MEEWAGALTREMRVFTIISFISHIKFVGRALIGWDDKQEDPDLAIGFWDDWGVGMNFALHMLRTCGGRPAKPRRGISDITAGIEGVSIG